MDQQIIYLAPGLTYNAAISTGNLHFQLKNIYIAAVQRVARLPIVLLDDTVLHCKILSSFDEIWIKNNPKMFWEPSNLSKSLLSVLA